jgi:hypothetical protein
MGNWKEKLGEEIVGDCFGGYASHMSNVDPKDPYTEEIKEKFVFATSQKSKLLEMNDEHVLAKDFDSKLTNKIIGISE